MLVTLELSLNRNQDLIMQRKAAAGDSRKINTGGMFTSPRVHNSQDPADSPEWPEHTATQ